MGWVCQNDWGVNRHRLFQIGELHRRQEEVLHQDCQELHSYPLRPLSHTAEAEEASFQKAHLRETQVEIQKMMMEEQILIDVLCSKLSLKIHFWSEREQNYQDWTGHIHCQGRAQHLLKHMQVKERGRASPSRPIIGLPPRVLHSQLRKFPSVDLCARHSGHWRDVSERTEMSQIPPSHQRSTLRLWQWQALGW